MVYITGASDELDVYDGSYSNIGRPLAKTGGVHFDAKWNSGKESINVNYRIGSIDVKGETGSIIQQNLSDDILKATNTENFENYALRHRVDAAYENQMSSSTVLKIGVVGVFRKFNTSDNFMGETDNEKGLVNNNRRTITSDGNQKNFNVTGLLTQKLSAPGQTLSLGATMSDNNLIRSGYLNSIIENYDSTTHIDSTILNQFENKSVKTLLLNTNITYSQPLSKMTTAIFNYAYGRFNNKADNETFNQSASGKYDSLDVNFSNNYQFFQQANQIRAMLHIKTKRSILNFGDRTAYTTFSQHDLTAHTLSDRTFLFWSPQIYYSTNLTQKQALSIRYSGSAVQPTIDQIQPVKVNLDPLNIVIGNAALRPAYDHRLELNYHNNNVVKNKSIYVSSTVTVRRNQITNSIITDTSTGSSTIQYVNLNSQIAVTYYVGINFNKTIKTSGISMHTRVWSNDNEYYVLINGKLSSVASDIYAASLSLQKEKLQKYSVTVSGSPRYYVNHFSVQTKFDNNSFGYETYGSGTLYINKKFEIESDVDYNFRGKTSNFKSQNLILWNASCAKTFLKNDNLKISVIANNLLDQNVFISRSVVANTIIQNHSTGIERYFMLSVSWDFTKFKKVLTNE